MTDPAAKVLFLVGSTAVGKAETAYETAERLDGEIVSLDSMKVYRGMDIGTAKPSKARQTARPVHLIDLVWPWEEFDLATYVDSANRVLADITGRGKVPIVTGGTGLYLRGLLFGVFRGPSRDSEIRARLSALAEERGTAHLHDLLRAADPVSGARIHPNDRLRINRALEVWERTGVPMSEQQVQYRQREDIRPVLTGIRRNREDLYRRIERRVDVMMDQGFLEEVRTLWTADRPPGRSPSRALGYVQLADHLNGRWDLPTAVREIKKETRRFAKRQMTWFRSFDGLSWIDAAPATDAATLSEKVLACFAP